MLKSFNKKHVCFVSPDLLCVAKANSEASACTDFSQLHHMVTRTEHSLRAPCKKVLMAHEAIELIHSSKKLECWRNSGVTAPLP